MARQTDSLVAVPEWVHTNRRLCDMFGIDAGEVDYATIELSAHGPPVVTVRKLWVRDREVVRSEHLFELVPVEDEVSDGD